MIDVDQYKATGPPVANPKKWIPALNLFDADRDALLDPVGWLTDSIMNASQNLLKSQFPDLNSLQSVAIGNTMFFMIQTGKFLQILYSNSHWVTAFGDGVHSCRVDVFDSAYNSTSTSEHKYQLYCVRSRASLISGLWMCQSRYTSTNIVIFSSSHMMLYRQEPMPVVCML